MPGSSAEAVIATLQFQIGIADSAAEQPDQGKSLGAPRPRLLAHETAPLLETNRDHIVDTLIMLAELACFKQKCGARFPIDEPIYNCRTCGALLEVSLRNGHINAEQWKKTWRERRISNEVYDQSGVWRYRELLPFDGYHLQAVSLREGNTPLLNAPRAATYATTAASDFQAPGL